MSREDPKNFSEMTVLIVDDMYKTRALIRQMLTKMGFSNILDADGGDSAWKILLIEPVHLILCDINMARMNGFQLLKGVRRSTKLKDVPILMVSSSHNRDDIIRCVQGGANGYVVKPFSLETLQKKIEESIRARMSPKQVEAQEICARAEDLRGEGDIDAAIKAYEAALSVFPEAQTHFQLGDLFHGKGDVEMAITHFTQAIAMDNQLLKAYEELADLYREKGDFGKATIIMKKSLQIQPDSSKSLALLGELLLSQDRLEEAQENFDRAMAIDPTNAGIKTLIGDAYLKGEKFSDAEDAFLRALSDDPQERVYVLNRLGIALRKQAKFAQAVEQYRKALALDPGDEVLYYNLARAYWEAGERVEAVSSLRQALELLPEFSEAQELLDTICKR